MRNPRRFSMVKSKKKKSTFKTPKYLFFLVLYKEEKIVEEKSKGMIMIRLSRAFIFIVERLLIIRIILAEVI